MARNNDDETIFQVFEFILEAKKEADEHGLWSEVLASALLSLKGGYSDTIEYAFQDGLNEWIK